MYLIVVRTRFGLDSKIGMDSGPIGPISSNNKFLERGK